MACTRLADLYIRPLGILFNSQWAQLYWINSFIWNELLSSQSIHPVIFVQALLHGDANANGSMYRDNDVFLCGGLHLKNSKMG